MGVGSCNWVIADIHGCMKQFMEIINNPEIKENDIVHIAGDIIDRGPGSAEMLDWAMENISEDGRYRMIRGNHEDDLIYEYESFKRKTVRMEDMDLDCIEEDLMFQSLPVYELRCRYGFDEYMARSGKETIGDIITYIRWMKKLRLYERITTGNGRKIVLAHAWFKGHMENGVICPDISESEILCHREIDEQFNLTGEDYQPMEDGEVLVHGHTPVIAVNGYRSTEAAPIFRKNSINIDGGCFIGKNRGRLMAMRLEDNYVIYSGIKK